MPSSDSTPNPPTAQARFASTHWSAVLAAAQTQSPEATQALEGLCAAYWYPLYAFLRRKGLSPHDAEDLTQEFFSRRIATKLIFRGMRPGEGKFRTWLLNSLMNLLRNEWDRQRAQKRGGDRPHFALDLQDAEGRYLIEPGHDLSPDRLYERTWALTLLERTLAQLRAQYEQDQKESLFDELKCYLPGALSRRPYAEAARQMGKSEEAIKMAVSRLRQEFGRQLKEEIKRTVSHPNDVESELRDLMAALSL